MAGAGERTGGSAAKEATKIAREISASEVTLLVLSHQLDSIASERLCLLVSAKTLQTLADKVGNRLSPSLIEMYSRNESGLQVLARLRKATSILDAAKQIGWLHALRGDQGERPRTSRRNCERTEATCSGRCHREAAACKPLCHTLQRKELGRSRRSTQRQSRRCRTVQGASRAS